MLTLGQKIDVRRHLGVPFAGLASSGMTMGIRTIFEAGQLEFYMLNLQPAEESVLTGSPYGSIRMYGTVIVGQVITVTINGTPIVYTTVFADVIAADPRQSVAINVANAINSLGVGGVFAGGNSVLPSAPPSQLPGFVEVTLVASTATTFTVTASATNGFAAFVAANGSTLPQPNSTFYDQAGNTQTLVGYIAFCNYLQANIAVVSGNLSLLSAGGKDAAVFRPYEMRQRIELYNYWRESMGKVLSVSSNAWGFRGSNGNVGGGGSSA